MTRYKGYKIVNRAADWGETGHTPPLAFQTIMRSPFFRADSTVIGQLRVYHIPPVCGYIVISTPSESCRG